MKKIKISDKAKQDLQEIWDYIGRENPEVADRLIPLPSPEDRETGGG